MDFILIDYVDYFIMRQDQVGHEKYYFNRITHSFTLAEGIRQKDGDVPVLQIRLGDLYRDYVDIRGIAYQLPETFPDGKDFSVKPGRICLHSPENLILDKDLINCVEKWAHNPRRNAVHDLHTYLHLRVLSLMRKWLLNNNITDIRLVHPYDNRKGLELIDFQRIIKRDYMS